VVVVVVVIDILKPNHSPKTAVNRQVRFIKPGVGGLLGAKCKHVANSKGRTLFRSRPPSPWKWGYIGCKKIFFKRKEKKKEK
jgi:hypothetical protein